MLSQSPAATLYEVLIFAPPDHREEVRECGVFVSEGAADQMATRLRMWLHQGVLSEALFANCGDAADRETLLTLRDSLCERGIDPALTVIEGSVRQRNGQDIRTPWEARGWNPHDPDHDGDTDDAPDPGDGTRTPLTPADVTYYMLGDADETEGE